VNLPASGTELIVQFVSSFGAGFCGDDRWGNNHSDKSQGNQQVMHSDVSWWGPAELFHTLIIGVCLGNLNPTKKLLFSRPVQ